MTAKSLPRSEIISGIAQNLPFSGIATSSDEVCEGDLFLALRGAHHDGSTFICEALARGASFAVSETVSAARTIRCRSAVSLLYALARARMKEVAPRVVAVTGSVGKSTYLAYAKSLFEDKLRLHYPSGNYNTDVGVPMTILAMPSSTELLLLEMGARHPGEIARLSLLARPHVAVITRIGHSHLESFGDLAGVLRAKSEILLGLRDQGTLILNQDDPLLFKWSRGTDCRRIGVSLTDPRADLLLKEDKDGKSLSLKFKDKESSKIELEKRGEASELAAALAAATALCLGFTQDEVAFKLSKCRAPAMRQELIWHGGILYIMDAYNASPESAAAALKLLQKADVSGRRIALLGDMQELGCDSEALHFSLGAYAFRAGVTDLYCIGSLARKIAEGAAAKGLARERIRLFSIDEKEKLCAALKQDLTEGDALLLKASRALGLESVLSILTK